VPRARRHSQTGEGNQHGDQESQAEAGNGRRQECRQKNRQEGGQEISQEAGHGRQAFGREAGCARD
jgi:hypothetical protein